MVKPMDRLESRLKDDARLIRADVSPALQERIRVSLEATRPENRASPEKRIPGTTLWWVSSLTGLAAAALIIVIINWNTEPGPGGDVSGNLRPELIRPPVIDFPLNAATADWAAPLEEELRNLQSDLEKARENVERDLRMSF